MVKTIPHNPLRGRGNNTHEPHCVHEKEGLLRAQSYFVLSTSTHVMINLHVLPSHLKQFNPQPPKCCQGHSETASRATTLPRKYI